MKMAPTERTAGQFGQRQRMSRLFEESGSAFLFDGRLRIRRGQARRGGRGVRDQWPPAPGFS